MLSNLTEFAISSLKKMKYCPKCGSENIVIQNGVNGSDYLVCGDCGIKLNIFEDDTPTTDDN